ncbi:MAG: winged helix DNA-binding domain-containing protein [Chloroflexi bacterium]|nr:winged helix DNA-binding domain-containing protein [Chloroflexota bacterium]
MADRRRDGVAARAVRAGRDAKLASGRLIEVRVDRWRQPQLALAEDRPILDLLAAGGRPAAWEPLEATTDAEATFLSPLDPVSARGRAKPLFGFDYVWEVYKPAHLRRWGYYTLPILWGDRLVARFDSKLHRAGDTLVINGFWLEDEALARDDAFAEALGQGMSRFAAFLGARRVDAGAVAQPSLRKRVGVRRTVPGR